MVLDDDRDSRGLLGALFEQCGASVVACGEADAAFEALDRQQVDLLVADIAMPGVDGYELIRRVRRLHSGLPAVAVGACAHPRDRRKALAFGYDGHCAKPIEARQFLQTVRDVLRAHSE